MVVHDDIGDHVFDALLDADGFKVDEASKLKRFNESLQDCVGLKQWRLVGKLFLVWSCAMLHGKIFLVWSCSMLQGKIFLI